MATPTLPALVQAAIDKLRSFYNGNRYVPQTPGNAGNPGGFDGDGHAINFVAALRDVATAVSGVMTTGLEILAEIRTVAARFESAVAAIKAGPVTSVRVGDQPAQSGAVVVDLSTLSAAVEAELNDVRAAQDVLEARAASTQAYSLAFGG